MFIQGHRLALPSYSLKVVVIVSDFLCNQHTFICFWITGIMSLGFSKKFDRVQGKLQIHRCHNRVFDGDFKSEWNLGYNPRF
jgi:hypothetical protein